MDRGRDGGDGTAGVQPPDVPISEASKDRIWDGGQSNHEASVSNQQSVQILGAKVRSKHKEKRGKSPVRILGPCQTEYSSFKDACEGYLEIYDESLFGTGPVKAAVFPLLYKMKHDQYTDEELEGTGQGSNRKGDNLERQMHEALQKLAWSHDNSNEFLAVFNLKVDNTKRRPLTATLGNFLKKGHDMEGDVIAHKTKGVFLVEAKAGVEVDISKACAQLRGMEELLQQVFLLTYGYELKVPVYRVIAAPNAYRKPEKVYNVDMIDSDAFGSCDKLEERFVHIFEEKEEIMWETSGSKGGTYRQMVALLLGIATVTGVSIKSHIGDCQINEDPQQKVHEVAERLSRQDLVRTRGLLKDKGEEFVEVEDKANALDLVFVSPEQKRICDRNGGHLVIQGPAGTGKTIILMTKIVQILERNKAGEISISVSNGVEHRFRQLVSDMGGQNVSFLAQEFDITEDRISELCGQHLFVDDSSINWFSTTGIQIRDPRECCMFCQDATDELCHWFTYDPDQDNHRRNLEEIGINRSHVHVEKVNCALRYTEPLYDAIYKDRRYTRKIPKLIHRVQGPQVRALPDYLPQTDKGTAKKIANEVKELFNHAIPPIYSNVAVLLIEPISHHRVCECLSNNGIPSRTKFVAPADEEHNAVFVGRIDKMESMDDAKSWLSAEWTTVVMAEPALCIDEVFRASTHTAKSRCTTQLIHMIYEDTRGVIYDEAKRSYDFLLPLFEDASNENSDSPIADPSATLILFLFTDIDTSLQKVPQITPKDCNDRFYRILRSINSLLYPGGEDRSYFGYIVDEIAECRRLQSVVIMLLLFLFTHNTPLDPYIRRVRSSLACLFLSCPQNSLEIIYSKLAELGGNYSYDNGDEDDYVRALMRKLSHSLDVDPADVPFLQLLVSLKEGTSDHQSASSMEIDFPNSCQKLASEVEALFDFILESAHKIQDTSAAELVQNIAERCRRCIDADIIQMFFLIDDAFEGFLKGFFDSFREELTEEAITKLYNFCKTA